jgi:hypothetical protein
VGEQRNAEPPNANERILRITTFFRAKNLKDRALTLKRNPALQIADKS